MSLRETPTYVASSSVAYDADIPGSPTGVIVNAAGGLVVTDIEGNEQLHTVPAGALPWKLELRFRQIKGNGSGSVGDGTLSGGTNVALANLAVLHGN